MANIENVQVYGLAESIYRSGYPMRTEPPNRFKFDDDVGSISLAIKYPGIRKDNEHVNRAIKLAQAKGGGHDQFLTGVTVTFDLTASNKFWVEAERYTFLNFISSQSTMHRITQMNIKECCNEYVNPQTIEYLTQIQQLWKEAEEDEHKKRLYCELLYNLPSGFELTAGMITNYRCLKNIYAQRRTHRLKDWNVVCDWIETLPMAKELIAYERR